MNTELNMKTIKILISIIFLLLPSISSALNLTVDPMIDIHRFNADLMYYNLYCESTTKILSETAAADGTVDGKAVLCPARPDCPKLDCSKIALLQGYKASEMKIRKADTADTATNAIYAEEAGYGTNCSDTAASASDLKNNMFWHENFNGTPNCVKGGALVAGKVIKKTYIADTAVSPRLADTTASATSSATYLIGTNSTAYNVFQRADLNSDGIIDQLDVIANKKVNPGNFLQARTAINTIENFSADISACGNGIETDSKGTYYGLSSTALVTPYPSDHLICKKGASSATASFAKKAVAVNALHSDISVGTLGWNNTPSGSNTTLGGSGATATATYNLGAGYTYPYADFLAWYKGRGGKEINFQFDKVPLACLKKYDDVEICTGQNGNSAQWVNSPDVVVTVNTSVNYSYSCTAAPNGGGGVNVQDSYLDTKFFPFPSVITANSLGRQGYYCGENTITETLQLTAQSFTSQTPCIWVNTVDPLGTIISIEDCTACKADLANQVTAYLNGEYLNLTEAYAISKTTNSIGTIQHKGTLEVVYSNNNFSIKSPDLMVNSIDNAITAFQNHKLDFADAICQQKGSVTDGTGTWNITGYVSPIDFKPLPAFSTLLCNSDPGSSPLDAAMYDLNCK